MPTVQLDLNTRHSAVFRKSNTENEAVKTINIKTYSVFMVYCVDCFNIGAPMATVEGLSVD